MHTTTRQAAGVNTGVPWWLDVETSNISAWSQQHA